MENSFAPIDNYFAFHSILPIGLVRVWVMPWFSKPQKHTDPTHKRKGLTLVFYTFLSSSLCFKGGTEINAKKRSMLGVHTGILEGACFMSLVHPSRGLKPAGRIIPPTVPVIASIFADSHTIQGSPLPRLACWFKLIPT